MIPQYRVLKVVYSDSSKVGYKVEKRSWINVFNAELYDNLEEAIQAIESYKKKIYKPMEYVVYEEVE